MLEQTRRGSSDIEGRDRHGWLLDPLLFQPGCRQPIHSGPPGQNGFMRVAARCRLDGFVKFKLISKANGGRMVTVQHDLPELLNRIAQGNIDPSFVVTHRGALENGPDLYKKFRDKIDGCVKVVMKPHYGSNGHGCQK